MTPDPTTDEAPAPALEGGVSVSRTQLGAVYDFTKGNNERLVKLEGHVADMRQATSQTATGMLRLVDIAEAKRAEELQDRQAALDSAKAAADRRDQTWLRLVDWWSGNWKIVVGLLLLLLWPQGVGYLQSLGVLPTPRVVAAEAAPVVLEVPVPVPVPVEVPAEVEPEP